MYISLGLTAAYSISSILYNYYKKCKLTPEIAIGRITSITQNMRNDVFTALVSDQITQENYNNKLLDISGSLRLSAEQLYSLVDYINVFGVQNMQAALNSIVLMEEFHLYKLPYIYMPYHQYIKLNLRLVYGLEFIYQQRDIIRLIYDYQIKSLSVYKVIDRYGIESISILRLMGANFSSLSEFYIELIVRKYGKESIDWLKDAGVNFSELYRFKIVGIINTYGKDSIYWLKNSGVSFSELDRLDIGVIVKVYGKNYIQLLKDAGANFSKLYGFDIVDIAKRDAIDGKGSLKLLKNADADFNMLGPDNIAELIINYGLEIIPFLVNDLDVKISKMGGGDIANVAKIYGIDSLELLKDYDADFSKFEGENIVAVARIYGKECLELFKDLGVRFSKVLGKDIFNFIMDHGLEIIPFLVKVGGVDFSKMSGGHIVGIAKEYGNDSLQLLKDADTDLNMLGPDDLGNLIINNGLDVIPFLVDISGVDFSKINEIYLMFAINKYAKDGINALHKAGVNFSVLDLNNVLSIIDNYGEEYIWLLQDVGVDFNQLSEGGIDMSNNLDTNINTIYSDSFSHSFEYIGLDNGVM